MSDGHWPRRIPWLLGCFIAVGPAATDMYLPAFPDVEASLHAAAGSAQFTLASWFAGLALGQVLQGWLSDRFGRRLPLAAGFALFAAAMAGGAFASSIGELAVLRFVAALGASAGMVIGRAVVRDLADGQRGAILMSRLVLVMGVAPIVAPTIGAALLLVADWRVIFWVQAVYGAGCTVLALKALPETLPEARRVRAGPIRAVARYGTILREPVFLAHALMGGAGSFCMFAYLSGASPVFIQGFGLSPAEFALLFGLCSCGLVAGSQINARLLRTYGLHTMLRAICRVSLVATTTLLAFSLLDVRALWMIVAPLFLVLSCQGFSNGNTAVGALSRHAPHAASAAALMGVFQYVLGAISGSLVGLLTDGTPRGMALLMFVGTLSAVAIDLVRPRP
jgi:DHA1 family bicyclomycin/chloramphenicol resistance-like MFS transporter